jgi:hypothetical protein
MNYQEIQRLTAEHMENPQVGDRFHEVYSWWVYVVDRQGDQLVIAEGRARPSDFPDGATFCTMTVQEFRQKNTYRSIPGYSVDYCDTDPKTVEGWLDKG